MRMNAQVRYHNGPHDETVTRPSSHAQAVPQIRLFVPRRAPIPLQGIALLLGVIGLAGVVLAVMIVDTSIAVIRNQTDLVVRQNVVDIALNAFKPLPGVVILMGAIISLAVAAIVLGSRRSQWWVIGVGVAAVTAFDFMLVVPLFTGLGPAPFRPAYSTPAPALSMNQFVKNGAVGRPVRGQPVRPVTIDRVLAAQSATYVQYHIPDIARDGQPTPLIVDDRGRSYNVNVGPNIVTTPREFARQLMPWHTAVQEVAVFPPLQAGVRQVTLYFQDNRPRVVQTVRVLLNRSLPPIHAQTRVVQLSGITLTIGLIPGAAVTRLTFSAIIQHPTIPARNVTHVVPSGPFATTQGHPLFPLNWDATCQPGAAGTVHCETWATFSSSPSGTRLIVAAPGLTLYDQYDMRRTISAPYRVSFVAP